VNSHFVIGEEDAKALNDLIDAAILGFYINCVGIGGEDKKQNDENRHDAFSLDYFCAKYLLSADVVKQRKLTARNTRKKLMYARKVSCSGLESFPEGCYDSKYFAAIDYHDISGNKEMVKLKS